jgi:hypothetical protein
MDTRQLIYAVFRVACAVVIWGGIAYSFYMGVRYGFRFPRSLHIMAVVIVILEAAILFLFPVPFAAITPVLGSLLVLLPVSPYLGWVLARGPLNWR